MTRTEITEDMISRFMSGGLRAYDVQTDKSVDFTRMSALRFLDMVLNPPPVIANEVLQAGLDELCRYSDRTGLLWKNMQAHNVLPLVYTAMKAAEPKPMQWPPPKKQCAHVFWKPPLYSSVITCHVCGDTFRVDTP